MASSRMHPLGRSASDDITSEISCQFKVLCSSMKAGSWINFPAFNTGEHFWLLWGFPNEGGVKGEIANLKFQLCYMGEWTDVKVNFNFGVLQKNESLSSVKWVTTTHTFPMSGKNNIILKNVVQVDELQRYLKDDYFIVLCNITILSTGYLGNITILSSLIGTSKDRSNEVRSLENKDMATKNLIDSGRETKEELATGLVEFKVVCSPNITANPGTHMCFPIFIVGEYCWYIWYYYQKDSHLDFGLSVSTETKDLKARIEFGVLKKDEVTSAVKWLTTTHTFAKCATYFSMDRFIQGDELRQHLQDEYFRVICKLTILSEIITSDHDVTILENTGKLICYFNNGPSPTLHDDFTKLLQKQDMFDVTFEVKGEIFNAHRLVFAARSHVFKDMLIGPTNKNNLENIKINEIEPKIFKAMLNFIYTDMLPNLKEESNQMPLVQIFQHLLSAADHYALERLKFICEDKLSKSITIDTVATTLVLSEKHHCPNLKSRCLEFIASSKIFTKVALTDGYAELLVSCPTIIKELRENFNKISL